MACEWLEAKYLECGRWGQGTPALADTVKAFLAKPKNRALVKQLAFEVKAPGYQAPETPARMATPSTSP